MEFSHQRPPSCPHSAPREGRSRCVARGRSLRAMGASAGRALIAMPLLLASRYAVLLEERDGAVVASPPGLSVEPGDTVVLVAASEVLLVAEGAEGTAATFLSPVADPDLAARGAEVRNGAQPVPCMTCHSVDGSSIVGPSWQGLYGMEEMLSDGTSVLVDWRYVWKSVREPMLQIACKEGSAGSCSQPWPPAMPPMYTEQVLPDADLEAIVAYLRSLSEVPDSRTFSPEEGRHEATWEGGAFAFVAGEPTGLMDGAYEDSWRLLARARYATWLHGQGQHALYVSEIQSLLGEAASEAVAAAMEAAIGHAHEVDHAPVFALLALLSENARLSLASATQEQLEALPGIGPVKAEAIVAAREAGSVTVAGLTAISGIGDATLAKARPFLRD